MAVNSITEGVRKWLRGCPQIKTDKLFSINMTGVSPIAYSLTEEPVHPVIKQYLDGSTMQTAAFALATRDAYSADTLEQLETAGFWHLLTRWMQDQGRKRAFPEMPTGDRPIGVSVTNSHYLYLQDANTAVYQLQFQITYYREVKK